VKVIMACRSKEKVIIAKAEIETKEPYTD